MENIANYVGRTVTVFTTSGGLSGSGFTGVLLSVDCNNIKLLCSIGAAPACPIGSSCVCNEEREERCNNGRCNGNGFNPLGSVSIIPLSAIVCFTQNAI